MSEIATARPNIDKDLDDAARRLKDAKREIGSVIYGQENVIDKILITILSGGHVLLIGVPGLAKTLMVDTVARVMGLDSARIQCTPDLMPSDILGSEVLEEDEDGKRHFRFIEGPVFTQFLMADEINRASPRTQSALLQAMQEKSVTVAGKPHKLPHPFHVLATQNPIEQEGTYPLPEAQLDRFLMQIDVDYPGLAAEREMLLATTSNRRAEAKAVFEPADLEDLQKLVRDMPVGESVVEAILTLVRRGRPGDGAPDLVNEYVAWAPGPRAAQSLMLACRARALLDGRSAPSVDDVIDLAGPILKHRMALNYQARANGVTLWTIIDKMTEGL
ncbi:AAA family ATPase [Micavibrio aeruginosavorus]|uniref:ATPase associated with various cellular activities family protein n=1 Tax=Micavibrio aeruginosavorus (strain ARL-13) TaxID=856793 RepID=G2KQR7_MICAA|nr:MoxR family ATPase [Micavibrio aeruginosavorus]AEP09995.1 ATPase associated with various cellular activities family protein [Micavibrio aeruginosavorus ARL-13]